MKYFKNVEAASIFRVSEKSVRNWIESARSGKLDLELHEQNGKHYLANTTKNQTLIKQLVERGQKYKNGRGFKVISPKPEFYDLYSPQQIFNILTSLDIHREIPLQYSYFADAAHEWDLYAQRLVNENAPNMLNSTIKLLDVSTAYIDNLIADRQGVNVIDLGVGNAMPVRSFLTHLHNKEMLKRYIGVDISEEMLKIADRNITTWFNNEVTFEKYVKDITFDRFEHTTYEDAFEGAYLESTANLIMLLGGTLSNLRMPDQVLQVINNSMGRNDYLVYGLKLDTEGSRRYFDFGVEPHQDQKLSRQDKFVLELLNIDESLYDVEQFFDEDRKSRYMQVSLKIDLTLEFHMYHVMKRMNLQKGEKIVLWRYRHQESLDVISQFEKAGFDLLHANKTLDQEYLLTISKVKAQAASL